MKNRLRRVLFVLAVLVELSLAPAARAQADPTAVLAGMIQQLQMGMPNAAWYGPELWRAMAIATNNTGRYPQLAQLGPVQNIVIDQRQQLPQGWLYAMTVQHVNGQSTWQMGINTYMNRIEYADFRAVPAPARFPVPNPHPNPYPDATSPKPVNPANPDPTPDRSSTVPPGSSDEACKKFPNLC